MGQSRLMNSSSFSLPWGRWGVLLPTGTRLWAGVEAGAENSLSQRGRAPFRGFSPVTCLHPLAAASRCYICGWRCCARACRPWRSGSIPGRSCAAPAGCRSSAS